MYNFNQHLHFIGIGGVGMAGIAEVLINLGYTISGSDIKASKLTDHIEDLGARVYIGHEANNVAPDTSVVVISSAISFDNPELISAQQRHIPVIPRAEMLAELMRMKYGVAVAGSHGKTTTTSMIAKILRDAGLDPTVIIGGRILSQPTGAQIGTSQYMVAESDESDGSFKLLKPAIAVVTNIDTEHLSHYGSFGALEAAFAEFMSSVPFYGLVVACYDDPVVAKIASNLKRRVCSYGLSAEYDFCATDIQIEGGNSSFTLITEGKEFGRVSIPLPGVHMVSNALAAIATGVELGAFVEEAVSSLESFPGVARRSEIVGECAGVLVIDDYGHHPTEISATLSALRQAWVDSESSGRLIAVFQPHRYSRTKELFSDFLSAFDAVDELFVGEIYSAGEQPITGISGSLLAQAIQHPNVSYLANLREVIPLLAKSVSAGDVVVTLGAGNVTEIAYGLVDRLKSDNQRVVNRGD